MFHEMNEMKTWLLWLLLTNFAKSGTSNLCGKSLCHADILIPRPPSRVRTMHQTSLSLWFQEKIFIVPNFSGVNLQVFSWTSSSFPTFSHVFVGLRNCWNHQKFSPPHLGHEETGLRLRKAAQASNVFQEFTTTLEELLENPSWTENWWKTQVVNPSCFLFIPSVFLWKPKNKLFCYLRFCLLGFTFVYKIVCKNGTFFGFCSPKLCCFCTDFFSRICCARHRKSPSKDTTGKLIGKHTCFKHGT